MARKPTQTPEQQAELTQTMKARLAPATELQHLEEGQNVALAANNMTLDATDVLLKVGQIQGLQFLLTVGDVAIARIFTNIKESKGYKNLPYRDKDGKPSTVETLDEFCKAFLQKSYTRCFELAKNLETLGVDLYEQAEGMGLRARDYQAIKALPGDDQAIIKQAIETSDREKVVELLQDMALKHAQEKESATKHIADLEADKGALGERYALVSEELVEAKVAARALKHMPPDQRLARMRQEISEIANEIESRIRTTLRIACDQYVEFAYENELDPDHWEPFLSQTFRLMQDAFRAIPLTLNIDLAELMPTDIPWHHRMGTPLPGGGVNWMDEASKALEESRAAEAEQQKQK